MSNYWQGVVEYNSEATGLARTVLMLLASNADEDGRAWPSVANLARRARCSERAVQYALRGLCALGELGMLANGHGRGPGRPGRASLYELRVQTAAPSSVEKGANSGANRVQTIAPQPSVREPSSTGTIVPAGSADVTTHGASRDADNNLVWSYCKARIWPNARTQPREKIALRLRTFTSDELKQAIDNFVAAKWWMERRDRFSAAWLFKSDGNIDRFLQLNVARDNRLRQAEQPRYRPDDEGEQVRDFEASTDDLDQLWLEIHGGQANGNA